MHAVTWRSSYNRCCLRTVPLVGMREFDIVDPAMFTDSHTPANKQDHDIPLDSRSPSHKRHTNASLSDSEGAQSANHETRLLPHQSATYSQCTDIDKKDRIRAQTAAWRPGFWKRLPTLGVTSLIGVLLCTAAAVAVLVYSNGQEVENWGTSSPSVVIAILSVVANSLLAVALAEGLIVSFWRTLLNGCTVSRHVPSSTNSLSWVSYQKQMPTGVEATHSGEHCPKASVEMAELPRLVSKVRAD